MPGDTTFPFNTIVYITDTIGSLNVQGSGVLISPDEVLTASHVVYQSGVGTASNILVYPGYWDGFSPYGVYGYTGYHYNLIQDPGCLITESQSQSDFALIHLSKPVVGDGYMSIESNFPAGVVDVSGYPASFGGAQYSSVQYVTQDPYYSLLDGTGIGDGSSGGPVWTEIAGQPYVVGTISSANVVTGAGYFTQITSSVYNTIESWLQQDAAACFVSGSRIATDRGNIPVGDLLIGDVVRTRFGGSAPIVWIGQRRLDCKAHPQPAQVQPVRVQRGAFGPGRPARDLLLSPDHSVYCDGFLIPVRYLLNGATIAREDAETVTYWHIELPEHNVVFAEGLPVESFLDTGNRSSFENGGAVIRLHPDFGERRWQEAACARLLREGPRLDAIRRRLHSAAIALGYRLTRNAKPVLRIDTREVPPVDEGRIWTYHIPPEVEMVRLVSRRWIPRQSHPWETDERVLGIAIRRVWVDDREVALDSPNLVRGWWDPERDWRWTDGDAEILTHGAHRLSFDLALSGDYWLAPVQRAPQSRQAG